MKMDNDVIHFLVLVNVFMLLAAFVIWKLVMRHARQAKMHYLQVKEMELAHVKALMAARLEMRDLTFQEVAQELHDNIKSNLTVSKLHLHNVHALAGSESDPMIEQSIEILEKAIKDIGDLSRSLNTDWLKGIGLTSALEREVEKMKLTGRFMVETDFSYHQEAMEPDKELSIFRIVQEAFNNIITHSGAGKVLFTLHYETTRLYCTITDDGKGFHIDSAARNGTGLHNMHLRAKALNARLVIHSSPGKGTTVILSVPYKPVPDQQNEPSLAEGVKPPPSFNLFQRMLIIHTHPSIMMSSTVFYTVFNLFLSEQMLWPSLIAFSILCTYFAVVARKKNFDKLVKDVKAEKMFFMLSPLNVILLFVINGIVIYGFWTDNTPVLYLAGIPTIVFCINFWLYDKRNPTHIGQ